MGATSRVTTLLAILGFVGCQCEKKGGSTLVTSQGIPQISKQVTFGNVQVGQTVRLGLPLVNAGVGNLSVDSQTVSGPPFAEQTLFKGAIAPGGHGTALLSFSPTQAGPATGMLTVVDDGNPSQVTVSLVGNGLDLDLVVTPSSVAFGQVPVDSAPPPNQTVTFQNDQATPVYVTFSATGMASEYTVADSTGAPLSGAIEIMQNSSHTVTVTFAPDAVSVFNSSFSYTPCEDAAGTVCLSPIPIALSGQGVTGALTLAPSPISFNGVPQGASAQQAVTISNTGNAAATVTCIYLQSLGASACGTASATFSLGAPSAGLPATLQAGGSLTVAVTYDASASAASADVLAVTYTPQGVSASATATDNIQTSQSAAPCQLTITPASLLFSPISVGNTVTEIVTLGNSGSAACQVTGIAIDSSSNPSYGLASGQTASLTIPAGGSSPIGVAFDLNNNNPPSTRRGKLDFQSNDSFHASVQVPLVATLASPYAGGGAWPRWHHDNIQSGLSPSDTSGLAGTVAWTVQVGPSGTSQGVDFGFGNSGAPDYLNSPVVNSAGTIYQVGMDGNLNAISPSGALQWKTMLVGPLQDTHPSTPIVAADGTLFVALGEQSAKALFHVSAGGSILDVIPPESGGDGYDLPAILTNGGLLLGGDDGSGAFAYSVGGSGSFDVVAQNHIDNSWDQMSSVVGPDDTTYWCGGSSCSALSPVSGSSGFATLWGGDLSQAESDTSDLALDVTFTGNLMILLGGWTADLPIIGGNSTGSQVLVSVNPQSGQLVWSLTLPAPGASQTNPNYIGVNDASVGNSCPAIGTDGTVYVGNFDGLHAVDGATGTEKAGFPFPTGSDVLTAPAIGGDGTIFFGTADGTFYAIKPDGTLRFKLSAGGRVAGSPAIGPTGAVYFTADDGNVYAVN